MMIWLELHLCRNASAVSLEFKEELVNKSLMSSFLNDSLQSPERRLLPPHSPSPRLVQEPRRPQRYVQFFPRPSSMLMKIEPSH